MDLRPAANGRARQVTEGEEGLCGRYRKLSNQIARSWPLSSGSDKVSDLRRRHARFYVEVRVSTSKIDAQKRQTAGKPVSDETQRKLSALVASSTASGFDQAAAGAIQVPAGQAARGNPPGPRADGGTGTALCCTKDRGLTRGRF